MTRRLMTFLTLLALAGGAGVGADTILLRGGGKINAESWDVQGSMLVIETAGGTLKIDRAEVLRIDPSGRRAVAPRAPSSPSAAGPSPAGTAAEETPPRGASQTGPSGLTGEAILTLRGHEAYRQGEYAEALSLYRQALAAAPDYVPAAVSAASASLALGDAPLALDKARLALIAAPGNADAWALLGQAQYALDRLDEAERSLERSLSIRDSAPLRDLLDRVRREGRASTSYSVLSTPHFRVEYDGGTIPRLGRDAIEFLENSFDEMARTFRHYPSRSLTVIFYPRDQFHELTGAGESIAGLYDGRVRIPLGGPDRLTHEIRRVLRHELAHGFIDSKANGNAPRWLHEGLAQRVEPQTARGRERLVVRGTGGAAGWGGSFTYLSALSLVEHIVDRRGEQAVLNLLDRLGRGEGFDEACRGALSFTWEDLLEDWRSSLQSRLRRPGRARGVAR